MEEDSRKAINRASGGQTAVALCDPFIGVCTVFMCCVSGEGEFWARFALRVVCQDATTLRTVEIYIIMD